jgi:hypothetical protein
MLHSAESLVQHACEQAIRSRLHDLDDARDHAARSAARRSSLHLLQLALHEDRLDRLQLQHLVQLVDAYEQRLRSRPLPRWPGAEARLLREQADELVAIAVAREQLGGQR